MLSIRGESGDFPCLRRCAPPPQENAGSIPYGKEFLAELDDLGRFAKDVLVEGGLFLTFYGQYYRSLASSLKSACPPS